MTVQGERTKQLGNSLEAEVDLPGQDQEHQVGLRYDAADWVAIEGYLRNSSGNRPCGVYRNRAYQEIAETRIWLQKTR